MKRFSHHAIDLLFPISLFFVFSATALIVLLFSANIYKTLVQDSSNRFEQGTSLSYVTNKIRQYDSDGTAHIYLNTFDGCDALTIQHDYPEGSYTTHIYEFNGELREIFLQKGASASAQSGTTILKIHDFEMQQISSGLYKFICTSADGSQESVILGLHSTQLQ